jgi:hypothetical protein
MRELGPVYTTGARAMLRELFCPSCGALEESQVACAGDEILLDEIVK